MRELHWGATPVSSRTFAPAAIPEPATTATLEMAVAGRAAAVRVDGGVGGGGVSGGGEGGGGRGGGADGGRWRRTCCPTAPQLHAPQAVDSAVDARLWFLGAVDARHRGVAASGAAGGCARQGGRDRACAQALPAQSYRHRNVAPIATAVRASAPATAAVIEFAGGGEGGGGEGGGEGGEGGGGEGGGGEGYCCELQAVTPAITNVRPVGGVQTSNTNTQR